MTTVFRTTPLALEHPFIDAVCMGIDSKQIIENCIEFAEPYDLQELLTKDDYISGSREELRNHGIKNTGDSVIGWIKKLCFEHFPNDVLSRMDFQANACFGHNNPDGLVLYQATDAVVPCLTLEVHGASYTESVYQATYDTLDQLRLLRSFDSTGHVEKQIGFVFPKYSSPYEDCQSCVTKVTIKFVVDALHRKYGFQAQFVPLQLNNVKDCILSAVDSVIKLNYTGHTPDYYYLRLSGDELMRCSDILQSGPLTQKIAPHSVVLYDHQYVWKYNPCPVESMQLISLVTMTQVTGHPPRQIAIPTMIEIKSGYFFRYEKYLPPLSRELLSLCIQEFVIKTADALNELHTNYKTAHLDVHRQNVCFAKGDKNFIVVLIDLDASTPIAPFEGSPTCGERYKPPSSLQHSAALWTSDRTDWKQLGLLAARILFPGFDNKAIVHQRLYEDDDFLCSLIDNGEWNKRLALTSPLLQRRQSRPLDTILAEREEIYEQ